MPQASQTTLDNWPHGEAKALELLNKNFTETAGYFERRDKEYEPTDEEWAAIQYLHEEWDYSYTHD